jgi:hypothetical protein
MRSLSTRFTGLLLVALGLWGGLVPFVGHYFHFAMGPDKSWDWTTARLYLDVLPAAATILGGLNLMSAGPRRSARLGALLALAGGAWFAIGPEISQLWTAHGAQGAGHGSPHRQMLEMLTYHTGLGVLIVALAAYALPRFPVVEEAAVAPGRGGVAAATAGAGAGAGAGAVAGSRGDRWYHEPGALEDPVSQRDQAAANGVDERDAQATHAHHRHEAEAAAVGAVGAGALAHHEHKKHEAQRDGARQDVADREGAGGAVAGRDRVAGEEPAANAERGNAYDEAPTSVGGAQRGQTVDAAASGTNGAPAGPATSSDPAAGDPGVRRRRGGLLSSLLRR